MSRTFTDGKFNIEVIQIINNIIGLQDLKNFLNKYNEGFLIDNSRFSDNSIVIEFPTTNEEYHLSEGLFLTVNADYSITTFEEKEIKDRFREITPNGNTPNFTIDYGDTKIRVPEEIKFKAALENGFIQGPIEWNAAPDPYNVKAPDAPTALSKQVGGDHYKNFAIQPVKFITANNLGYIEGNVIKYLCRHEHKNGRKDLEKAIHYIEMLMDLKYPIHPEAEGEQHSFEG